MAGTSWQQIACGMANVGVVEIYMEKDPILDALSVSQIWDIFCCLFVWEGSPKMFQDTFGGNPTMTCGHVIFQKSISRPASQYLTGIMSW